MAPRRILVVSTDPIVARELAERVTRVDHVVAGISGSEGEALAMTDESTPELVLMAKASRSDESNVALVDDVRGRWKIPIVFLIEKSDEYEVRRAGLAEPHRYLVQPFTDRELRTTMDLALCKGDAARAVHDLEARFFTTSVDLLCFLDFNGYFKRINPAWERALGFTRQELMARPFIEFVHPDDRERTLRQNAAVRGGGQALAFENRYMCKDGSHRWLRWNAAPDSAEKVIYSVARDISASKQAEEERERLVRELQAALAEVKTLREILPICSYCRKIRDDENYWHTVESYIARHTTTRFSHGICPTCMETEVTPLLGDSEGE